MSVSVTKIKPFDLYGIYTVIWIIISLIGLQECRRQAKCIARSAVQHSTQNTGVDSYKLMTIKVESITPKARVFR